MSDRPVPVPDEASAPFWEAAARGELVLARCSRCDVFSHPPAPVCPRCHHTDPRFTFQPVDGQGAIRAWTVVRQPFLPGFADDLPIVLVDVALDLEGDVRLIGRLLDGPAVPLEAGAPVTVAFEPVNGFAIPAFTLVAP